jgi:hypothetical protein
MDNTSQIKEQLPARYAALADTPRVMGEALDALADLGAATMELGAALVDAGLPRPVWRSERASLRLLSPVLPVITVDAFLSRLEQFAMRDGPAWLHGTLDDLQAFHGEVAVLVKVARPLREVVYRLQHLPIDMQGGPRSDHPLQRVVRHPRLQAPLDTIAEILSDLEALAPFMRPLTPEQWRALRHASRPLPAFVRDAVRALPSRLWIRRRNVAPAVSGAQTAGVAAQTRSALGASRAWFLQRLASLRRRPRAQRWLLVSSLLVAVAAVLAVLAFSRQPQATGQEPSFASSAALTAIAGSGTATALATGSPASSPTSDATAGPAPKLALTCLVNGATATLTLKNVGASSLTWQAQPPPTLTVSPTEGALQAGQSAAAQVSAKNKKTVSGTITVIASHDTVSTEEKATCR